MTARSLAVVLLVLSFAVSGAAGAQSWSDSLKGAAEEAAKPATDKATDAAAKVDDANAKVEDAAAKAEAAKELATNPTDSIQETAKRAAGKGVQTATDSAMGGATMTDAAKKGGASAVQEAMGGLTGSAPAAPTPSPTPTE